MISSVKLWAHHHGTPRRSEGIRRHEFVIGPVCDSPLFERKARLYYCMRCGWRFLVCGATVAVLDEKGAALTGLRSSMRFSTFQEGPCPALSEFASDSKTGAGAVKPRPALRLVTPSRKTSEQKR